MWAIFFFFLFFPFSWSELQLYARPLRTLFLLGSLALWTLFFLTIRARRRRAEIFYRRKCHSFPYQFTDFFFFWFLQSRTKFSLSFPDRRATYVVEVLRPHLRHPIIIIKTLRFDWLGNKVSSELLLDITNLNLHLDLIISLTGNNKWSPTY